MNAISHWWPDSGLTCRKQWFTICFKYSSEYITTSSPRITILIASRSLTVTDPYLKEPTSTKPNQYQVPLIMWGSIPLMTMSTAIITVLHSAEVVHIPHEQWFQHPSVTRELPFCQIYASFDVWPRDHYKAFQWFHLACNVHAEVSPEVSVQITKGPLLCHVVLKRVHSFTHSFPTRRILRESTQSAPLIDTQN
jgi:hypothetical protein